MGRYAPPPQDLGLQGHKSVPSPVFPQAAATAAVVNAQVTLDILNNSRQHHSSNK